MGPDAVRHGLTDGMSKLPNFLKKTKLFEYLCKIYDSMSL